MKQPQCTNQATIQFIQQIKLNSSNGKPNHKPETTTTSLFKRAFLDTNHHFHPHSNSIKVPKQYHSGIKIELIKTINQILHLGLQLAPYISYYVTIPTYKSHSHAFVWERKEKKLTIYKTKLRFTILRIRESNIIKLKS